MQIVVHFHWLNRTTLLLLFANRALPLVYQIRVLLARDKYISACRSKRVNYHQKVAPIPRSYSYQASKDPTSSRPWPKKQPHNIHTALRPSCSETIRILHGMHFQPKVGCGMLVLVVRDWFFLLKLMVDSSKMQKPHFVLRSTQTNVCIERCHGLASYWFMYPLQGAR